MMIFCSDRGSYTPVAFWFSAENRSCHAGVTVWSIAIHWNGSEILLGLLFPSGFLLSLYIGMALGLHLLQSASCSTLRPLPHSDGSPGGIIYTVGMSMPLKLSIFNGKHQNFLKPRDLPSFRHGWKASATTFYVCIRPVTNLLAVRPTIQPRIIVRGFFL